MTEACPACEPATREELLVRITQLEAEVNALHRECVPLSNDGNYVFIDGPGDVALDWQNKRLKRAEAAEKLLGEAWGSLNFILAFYEPGQKYLDTEAWKHAEAGGRRVHKAIREYLDAQKKEP